MTTITLPPVTPAFRDAVRELAMQVGWRNVAKRIAYGPVKSETVAAFAPSGNGHKPKRTRFYGDKDYKYGLPGPNPSRNKAGGFKCPPPGGYEREWGDLVGCGTFTLYSQGARKPGTQRVSINTMQDREAAIERAWAEKQPRRES
jgi:hypothetical protein